MDTITTPQVRALTPADEVELLKRFSYHAPKDDQPARYIALRENARVLATQIIQYAPDSRERSLAITKLEEAVFWANAAIARNE